MKQANPYLNFDGTTEEAFTFYQSVFGGEFLHVMRFGDFGDEMGPIPDADLDKIAHIALPLGESTLMGSDALESLGHQPRVGNNVSITLQPDDAEEAEAVFRSLSEGGTVEMELQQTDWAERYASFTDRFGVRWMVNYEGTKG